MASCHMIYEEYVEYENILTIFDSAARCRWGSEVSWSRSWSWSSLVLVLPLVLASSFTPEAETCGPGGWFSCVSTFVAGTPPGRSRAVGLAACHRCHDQHHLSPACVVVAMAMTVSREGPFAVESSLGLILVLLRCSDLSLQAEPQNHPLA